MSAPLVLLLLLAEAGPAFAQATPPVVLLLVVGEGPGGDRVPGLYLAGLDGSAPTQIEAGRFAAAALSPDGATWAIVGDDGLRFVADPQAADGKRLPLAATHVAWLSDGSGIVALGDLDGSGRAVWSVAVDGTPTALASSDFGAQEIWVTDAGDVFAVREVQGEVVRRETVRLPQGGPPQVLRPFGIPRDLVAGNGTGHVLRDGRGVVLAAFDNSWSVILDADPTHRPVAYVGGALVWDRNEGTDHSWGITRGGASATLASGFADPVEVRHAAAERGDGRIAVEVAHGATSDLALVAPGSPATLASLVGHAAANLRGMAWGAPSTPPTTRAPWSAPTARATDAPQRVALLVPAGEPIAAGIWTAKPDGSDMRIAYAAPADRAPPAVLGAGPAGTLAFASADGLFRFRWDGSAAPERLVGVPVYAFDWSPGGTRLVYETDAPGSGTRLVLFAGGSSRILGQGSAPAFHTEDSVRFVRAGGGGVETVLLGLEPNASPRPLVDAAVPPRAFDDSASRFAYARDGRVYVVTSEGARVTVAQDGATPLALSGGALAFARSVTEGVALNVRSLSSAAPVALGPAAASIPAGAFVENATGLVAATRSAAGDGTVRYWPDLTPASEVVWSGSLRPTQIVAFRAHVPASSGGSGPVSPSFAVLPALGRIAAAWTPQGVFLFGGFDGGNSTDRIRKYDPRTDSVTDMQTRLPVRLHDAAAVHDGTFVWIFGGANGTARSSQILRYDPRSDEIRSARALLPNAASGIAAVWTGSSILIFGGDGAAGPRADALSFNVGTEQFEATIGQLATARSRAAAVWDGSRAIVFGGQGAAGPLDSIELRRGTAALPAPLSHLPAPTGRLTAAYDGVAVYLFGAGEGEPLRYDVAGDAILRMGARLPARTEAAAVWDPDRSVAYLFGGSNGTAYIDRVIRYDPARDTATPVAPPDDGTPDPKPDPVVDGNATGGDGGNSTGDGGNGTLPDDGGGPSENTGTNGTTTTNGTKNETSPPPSQTSIVLGESAGPQPARGVITLFSGRGAGSFTMQATSASGRSLALGAAGGDEGVAWDTGNVRNGRYKVTAYDENGTAIGEAEILVQNPRSTPQEIVVASATGVAVTVGLSAVWSQLASIFGAVKGWLLSVGEEEFKDRLRHKGAIGFAVAKGHLFVTGLVVFAAGALLGIASAYGEAANPSFFLADFLELLPFIALTVGVFYLGSVVFDHFYARHIGRESQFRVWAPGTVALTASTALFATPFGAPGFIEGSETDDKRLEGRRGLAAYCVLLALAIPFALLYLWRYEVYETGISTVLMLAVNLAVPVSRMPGALVWKWNKALWVVVTSVAFGLYWVSELALGNPVLFGIVGVLGLVGIAGVFFSERLLPKGYLEKRRAIAEEKKEETAEAVDALFDAAQAAQAGYTTPEANAEADGKDSAQAPGQAPVEGTDPERRDERRP